MRRPGLASPPDRLPHPLQFVDWSPTGIKCGVSPRPLVAVPGSPVIATPRSASMLVNSSALGPGFFRGLLDRFVPLYYRGAYLHWYEQEDSDIQGDFEEVR